MRHRSVEETSFMERRGYGLLKQFKWDEPFRKSTLERQFGADLVNAAIQLCLIEIRSNYRDMSEEYLYITERGIEVRDN